MGVDISGFAEKRNKEEGIWELVIPEEEDIFDSLRNYGIFGFLANVRNYSNVPVIVSEENMHRDLPMDSPWLDEIIDPKEQTFNQETHRQRLRDGNDWGFTWLTLKEMLDFNYDQTFEDLRVTREVKPNYFDGGITAEAGEGKVTTFRDFLGDQYFHVIKKLKALGDDPEDIRLVFYFN